MTPICIKLLDIFKKSHDSKTNSIFNEKIYASPIRFICTIKRHLLKVFY